MEKIIFVLSGGIGNIIQATPTVQCVIDKGYEVSLALYCNSSSDMDIFKLPGVKELYVNETPKGKYDYQLVGPFSPGTRFRAKKILSSRVSYAQHIPESEIYYDLIKQIGVTSKLPDIKINIEEFPDKKQNPKTVAIYPGSKHNWAMKRWDKYDLLANKFDEVLIAGTKKDIESHGDPSWIKTPWKWGDHVKFLTGSLQEMAYAISTCDMFIGNDGGLAHVAAATGIPTFVIFGPSSVEKNKPYAKNAHAIFINLPCRPCQFQIGSDGENIFKDNKADCPFKMRCMKEMSVNHVINKIKSIRGMK